MGESTRAKNKPQLGDTEERVRRYFRNKAAELSAAADQAICEHSGLVGGHREAIHRTYLSAILPARFHVGRGMIYGVAARSREIDIVIWDGQNYPSLPLHDHAFFFAESVRLMMESKSHWSADEFTDVLGKCDALRPIVIFPRQGSLIDHLDTMAAEFYALKHGLEYEGELVVPQAIGTAAIFLKGGQSIDPDATVAQCDDVDAKWPDVMLFLDAGRLIVKSYEKDDEGQPSNRGVLQFYDYGEDALLAFTSAIYGLLHERSVQVEDPLFLMRYAWTLQLVKPAAIREFRLHGAPPHRRPFWSQPTAGYE